MLITALRKDSRGLFQDRITSQNRECGANPRNRSFASQARAAIISPANARLEVPRRPACTASNARSERIGRSSLAGLSPTASREALRPSPAAAPRPPGAATVRTDRLICTAIASWGPRQLEVYAGACNASARCSAVGIGRTLRHRLGRQGSIAVDMSARRLREALALLRFVFQQCGKGSAPAPSMKLWVRCRSAAPRFHLIAETRYASAPR